MECILNSIPKALIAVPTLPSLVGDCQTNKTQQISGAFLSTFIDQEADSHKLCASNMVPESAEPHLSGTS